MRRVIQRSGWLSWILPHRRRPVRRPAVLELLRLEERNPPSSLLYPDGGPETRHDLRDSALSAPAAPPPSFLPSQAA